MRVLAVLHSTDRLVGRRRDREGSPRASRMVVIGNQGARGTQPLREDILLAKGVARGEFRSTEIKAVMFASKRMHTSRP